MDNTSFSRFLRDWAVVHLVLGHCAPSTIMKLAKTCRGAKNAVQDYSRRAWCITTFLQHFFTTPRELLSRLDKTDAVIAGLLVQLFFDRREPRDDGFEIYVQREHLTTITAYLQAEGYTSLEHVGPHGGGLWDYVLPAGSEPPIYPDEDDALLQPFRHTDVLVYRKPETFKTICLFTTEYSALSSILRYPYTCLTNILTGRAAYSCYPRESIEYKCALTMRPRNRASEVRMTNQLLMANGFSVYDGTFTVKRDFPRVFQAGERWIGDGNTWKINFSPEELEPSAFPSTLDHVENNGWRLSIAVDGTPRHSFFSIVSPSFQHRYCVPLDFLRMIGPDLHNSHVAMQGHQNRVYRTQHPVIPASSRPLLDHWMIDWKASYAQQKAERDFISDLLDGRNTYGRLRGITAS